MEGLARLVSDSLARHNFEAPLDHRRIEWSRWFRCESSFDLLLVPSKPGLYVNRVRFEPGFKVAPHYHDEERVLVVLSGTLYFGLGDTWDESKMKPYQAGTFFTEPPGVRHFTWAKDGEVILHITGMGPSKTTLVEKK